MVMDAALIETQSRTDTSVQEVVHTLKTPELCEISDFILTILIQLDAFHNEATTEELASKNAMMVTP